MSLIVLAFDSCMNDSSGDLFELLVYEEVASVSASLKAGISGVEIDYDHICFAGPPLWNYFVPTLCKILEMVLLNRLEKYADEEGPFSDMRFVFKERLDVLKRHLLS